MTTTVPVLSRREVTAPIKEQATSSGSAATRSGADAARARTAPLSPGAARRSTSTVHICAWRAPGRAEGFGPEAIRSVQAGLRAGESEGRHRMRALHGGRADALEITPNL